MTLLILIAMVVGTAVAIYLARELDRKGQAPWPVVIYAVLALIWVIAVLYWSGIISSLDTPLFIDRD